MSTEQIEEKYLALKELLKGFSISEAERFLYESVKKLSKETKITT
ncbi:hypothetical protein BH11BAC4_BH11BAC4_14930 [soil metagenome]